MRIFAMLLLAAVSSACASGGVRTPHGPRDVITRSQIQSINVASAFDVVQQLRPEFLRSRGSLSVQNPDPPLPQVYVDGMFYGAIRSLHEIPADRVEEIRYLNARDATTRYGTGHQGGVIALRLRSG